MEEKWNFYYDESNRNFHGKATYWNDFDVPQIILNKLSDVQRDLFMGTPFGQFLELQPPKMLSQIIHEALVFLYETIPTLMDRGICVLKENSNLRISSWMESGKTPTNEQLNDTVFGSGQLRIEFLRPTVDELERMDFLEGFRFLQKADGGVGVEQNFVTKPKK
ncbi:hypothetical protein OROHE_003275 [Orobanche hederae]